jgi:hypothetical protein
MAVMSQVIQGKRFWPNPFSSERKHFVGTVSNEGFRFMRNVSYLNSFLPLIKGRVSSSDTGAVIDITMAGNPCVALAFMALVSFFGFILTGIISAPASDLLVVVGIIGGLILGYTGYTLGFKTQEAVDMQFLTDLFAHNELKS